MCKKIYVLSIIVFLVVYSLSTSVLAGTLPDTGQTTSYATGDDGYYAPCNPHSYTKLDENGNTLPESAPSWVMVRDNVTVLIWQKDTAPGTYTWQEAINYFEDLTLGIYSDWRLPTIKELSTLHFPSPPSQNGG